jgi:hypothetical protein
MTAEDFFNPKFLSLKIIEYAETTKSHNDFTQNCVILTTLWSKVGAGRH